MSTTEEPTETTESAEPDLDAIGAIFAEELGIGGTKAEAPPDEPDEDGDDEEDEPEEDDGDDEELEVEETDDEFGPPKVVPKATKKVVDVQAEAKKKLDGEWAHHRNAKQQLAAQQQAFHAEREAHAEQIAQAKSFAQAAKTNPEHAFELLAREAGVEPSEFLERINWRIANGAPGPSELSASEAAIRKEVADLRAQLDERTKRETQQQTAAQIAAELDGHAATLATFATSGEDGGFGLDLAEYPFVAALANADALAVADELRWQVNHANDYATRSGKPVAYQGILEALDERLKHVHARGTAMAGHVSGEVATSKANGKKPQTGLKTGRRTARRQSDTQHKQGVSRAEDAELDMESIGRLLIDAGIG